MGALDLSDWDRSMTTNVPGESGDPSSPHYSDLLAMITVVTLTILLNSTGISLATRRDVDFNHELRSAGFAACRRHTWARSALQHLEIYTEHLASKSPAFPERQSTFYLEKYHA